MIPFQIGLPALDLFPHAAWAKLVARQVRAETPEQLAYSDPAGLRSLRVAIAEHLRASRAVRCVADQILIVPGSQAALRLAAATLLEPNDRVAIEEPGYFGAHRAFRAAGAQLVPVPVDEEGLHVAALQRRGTNIRAVYVTPSHQYPLGMTMSASRRFALLDWAERHQAWILEDDYDSEFRYISRPVGALQGMDARDRVIYIGTFSKALFPAVRVGYVVVPPPLWTRFLESRFAFDMFTPTLYQRALAEFLKKGHFARHLRRMRSAYLERRDALLRGLARHCGDLVQRPQLRRRASCDGAASRGASTIRTSRRAWAAAASRRCRSRTATWGRLGDRDCCSDSAAPRRSACMTRHESSARC